MDLAITFSEQHAVADRLGLFGVIRDELVQVAHAAAIARSNCVPSDPVNARGLKMWMDGTRKLREVFLPKGWRIDRTDNIESVFDPRTGIKIIYQNSDSAADTAREPRAISGKGRAAERMVEEGQGEFTFPKIVWRNKKCRTGEHVETNSTTWFLCVAVKNDEVLAELSCPRSIEAEQFVGFHERIFILQSGDWGLFDPGKVTADPGEQDYDISVIRK